MTKRALRGSWILVAALGIVGCGGENGSSETATSEGQELTVQECTGRNANAVTAGEAAGASLVQQAWASVNDCARFTYFEGIIHDNASRLTCGGSSYTNCRCLGLKKGMEDKLTELEAACTSSNPNPNPNPNPTPTPGPTVDCTSGTNLDSYNYGVQSGQSLATQAWNRSGCSGLTKFQDAIASVLDILVAPDGASQFVVCRVNGYRDGLSTQAQTYVNSCH